MVVEVVGAAKEMVPKCRLRRVLKIVYTEDPRCLAATTVFSFPFSPSISPSQLFVGNSER